MFLRRRVVPCFTSLPSRCELGDEQLVAIPPLTPFQIDVALVDQAGSVSTMDMESWVEVNGRCLDTVDSTTFIGVNRNGALDVVTKLLFPVSNGVARLGGLMFNNYCNDMEVSFSCVSPAGLNSMCSFAEHSSVHFSNDIIGNLTRPAKSYVAFDLSMGMAGASSLPHPHHVSRCLYARRLHVVHQPRRPRCLGSKNDAGFCGQRPHSGNAFSPPFPKQHVHTPTGG